MKLWKRYEYAMTVSRECEEGRRVKRERGEKKRCRKRNGSGCDGCMFSGSLSHVAAVGKVTASRKLQHCNLTVAKPYRLPFAWSVRLTVVYFLQHEATKYLYVLQSLVT